MSTYTKEQLIARINQVTAINKYRISRDPDADGLAMDNELARIALASLEAEPVAYAEPQAFLNFQAGAARREWMWRNPGEDLIPLYNDPPAPVSVPDAYIRDERGRMMLNGRPEPRIGYGGGWNACRAAMLHGADGSSPVIPDGSISAAQFVKDYCKCAGWTEKEFYETQVPLPDNTSPSGWAAVTNSPLHIKAHVDLYMTAAPQQEAM